MILLWLFIATALSIAFARYNCSNKLFWILFMSFVTGISVAAVAHKLCNSSEKDYSVQVYPTQEFTVPSGSIYSLVTDGAMSTPEPIKAEPVGQDSTPEPNGVSYSSKCPIEDTSLIIPSVYDTS